MAESSQSEGGAPFGTQPKRLAGSLGRQQRSLLANWVNVGLSGFSDGNSYSSDAKFA
jgi:hypothetical protein